jgi:glycosyl transferase, family 25
MFTVSLQGGLGNQLFQIAFLEYLQKHTGIKYYVNKSDISRQISVHSSTSYFDKLLANWKECSSDIPHTLAFREENLLPKDWIDVVNKHHDINILFDGYFQNHNYITQEFIDKLSFSNEILNKYPNIQNTVFLHIRGGDYVTNDIYKKVHHINLAGYYTRAIDSFPRGTVFSVFTNDINYARTIVNLQNINHSVINENEVDSMHLMSKCNGGICANSSFSWWGARLNPNRKLILPSKWFNDSCLYTNGFYFPEATTVDVGMWDFVDKVVYINLEHRTDRNEHMKRVTETFGDKVSRFSAIENQQGALGCTMSHISVLRIAIENNWNNILIMEDDAEWYNFEQGYNTLKKLASNPYDVIMLGGSFVSYDIETYRLHRALTTTAYLVNKHYMPVLLQNFEEGLCKFLESPSQPALYALDTYNNRLQQVDNWYIVQPPLVYQTPTFSDVEKRFVDYTSLMGVAKDIPKYKLSAYGNCSWFNSSILIYPTNNTSLYCDLLNIPSGNDVSIFVSIEPEAIVNATDWLIDHYRHFKYILTYNEVILQKCPNAIKYTFGTSWIKEADYQNIDTSLKNFKVSTVVGFKNWTSGHVLRHQLYQRQEEFTKFPLYVYRSNHIPRLQDISNNLLLPDDNKLNLFKEFQFSIAIENSQQPNYFTEKLMDCLITKTIPIYWGCPNISEYFDTTGWIIFNDIDDLKQKLSLLNDSYYSTYTKVIDKNYSTAKLYVSFEKNLNRAICTIPDW